MSYSPFSVPVPLDRFISFPEEGDTGPTRLRQVGDAMLIGEEVVARRFLAPTPLDAVPRLLWLRAGAAEPWDGDAWNGVAVQMLAADRKWTVVISGQPPASYVDALRMYDMQRAAQDLAETLRHSGWLALAARLCDPDWFDEIDSLFEPEPGEPGPLPCLDRQEAKVIRGTALGRAPFMELQATRYVPGNRDHPDPCIAQEPWLTQAGAKLARAAVDLAEREGVDLAEAVGRVLAAGGEST